MFGIFRNVWWRRIFREENKELELGLCIFGC